MIWDDDHWVGLVINLGMWFVQILDPNTSLYDDRKVKRFMAPIVEVLPHLVHKFCKPSVSQDHGFQPFVYSRVNGIYQNLRSGDCGPLAMKLLEIQASDSNDEKMAEINDELVNDLRRQYAMDVYEFCVAPIYVADFTRPVSP